MANLPTQADEQLLDLIGDTAIHGHDDVQESISNVSFLKSNIISQEVTDANIGDIVLYECEYDDNTINIPSTSQTIMVEAEITSLQADVKNTEIIDENFHESDSFSLFIEDIKKRKNKGRHDECTGKKSKLVNSVQATEDLTNTTTRMLELKALYYKEKLKLKLRDVEAKEAIVEHLKIFTKQLNNELPSQLLP